MTSKYINGPYQQPLPFGAPEVLENMQEMQGHTAEES